MPTFGELAIAAGRKRLGCKEDPPHSNSGACVRAIQSSTGAYDTFWCASFVVKCWDDAGIQVPHSLRTASTYQLAHSGYRIGSPVPGCAVVWRPGASGHTEIFIRWVAPNVARTIGGNAGDAVREHDRVIGSAVFVAPPGISLSPKPAFRTLYYWTDPKAQPVMHGLHETEASRDAAVDKYVKRWGNPGHVRRHKVNAKDRRTGKVRAYWTFYTGPRARSADFTTAVKRNADMDKVQRARGRRVIPRSRRIPA